MNLTFDEMIERTLRPNVHTIFYSLKKVVDEVLPLLGIKEFYVKPARPGCRGVEFFVLSKEDFVVISKEETATYKQVKELLEDLKLDIDDFNMTLESSDVKKECKEFIESLEDGKKHSL